VPVVLRYRGYRFFFYSYEGDPREPAHIHVRKGDSEAKFWLRPFVTLSYNHGIPARELAELARVTQNERELIERAWHAYFQA
jgi:hypothetical protein